MQQIKQFRALRRSLRGTALLILCITAVGGRQSAAQCPSDLKHLRYFPGPVLWDAAKTACEGSTYLGASGGFATIRNGEDQRMLERLGFTSNTWIGGSSDPASGVWEWPDGTIFWNESAGTTEAEKAVGGYHNFFNAGGAGYAEPQNGADSPYLAIPYTYCDQHKWGDMWTTPQAFVCEYCVDSSQHVTVEGPFQIDGVPVRVHADRLGRVLIHQFGKHAAHKQGCQAPILADDVELTLDGCGFLPQATVQLLAAHATEVTLVDLRFGSMTSGLAALAALRTGGNWHNTDGTASNVASTWTHTGGTGTTPWCWDVDAQCAANGVVMTSPTAGTRDQGWPNMFHACGRPSCVHWLQTYPAADYVDEELFDPSMPNLSALPTDYHTQTWLTMELAVLPTFAPTLAPTSEPTEAPTSEPTSTPTSQPTSESTFMPTSAPTIEPTATPSAESTADPTVEPTAANTRNVPTSELTLVPVPVTSGERANDRSEFNPLWLLLLLLLPLSCLLAFLAARRRKQASGGNTAYTMQTQDVDGEVLMNAAAEPAQRNNSDLAMSLSSDAPDAHVAADSILGSEFDFEISDFEDMYPKANQNNGEEKTDLFEL